MVTEYFNVVFFVYIRYLMIWYEAGFRNGQFTEQTGRGRRDQNHELCWSVYTNIFELYLSLRSNFYAIIYINKINFPLIRPLQFQSIRTLLIAILSATPLTVFIFSR